MQCKPTPIALTIILCLSLLWGVGGAGSASAAPREQTAAPAGGDPVILAAGDIAQCNIDRDSLTAYLLETNQGAILTLGDNINLGATPEDFQNCFAPTWGRHFDRIYPAPGNHDYDTQGAAGYFGYFGDRATPLEPGCKRDCKGYYSFDLGAWHIVAINSEVASHAGTEQEQWLRADLAAHPAQCILAYWHRARISSSRNGLRGPEGPWQALYDYGADVVLSGHDHLYERFAPLNPALEPDPEHGIRQFIVGTGGHDHFDFRTIREASEVRDNEAWGVLKLTLHPDSYDWEFLPISGQTFNDKGSAPCVTPKNPPVYSTTSPAPATATTAVAIATAASPVSPAANIPSGGIDYTIRAGDTLGVIGTRYGLAWSVLAAANGLGAYPILEVGQVIRIPGVDEEIAPSSAQGVSGAATGVAPISPSASGDGSASKYTVQAGDTLFALALRFGVAQATLTQANSLSNADFLQVGQVLLIPGATGVGSRQAESPAAVGAGALTPTTIVSTTTVSTTVTPSVSGGGAVHTVAAGDTIISIAARYGKDWRQLLTLNGLNENFILQIGQKIRIE